MNNEKRIEIFTNSGIQANINANNQIIISHYCQPKGSTFSELGINEDELIETVVACMGTFDTKKSSLTTFPLEAAQEIKLYEDTKITQMPNLKAVRRFFVNSKLKKLPKLKSAGSLILENSSINALPKLKEAGILIAQNSLLKDLPSLKRCFKLCIIDCPLQELKELEEAEDIFVCSSNENEKIDIKTFASLKEVKKLFVANVNLKQLPKLKKADKIALYNCEIKSIKNAVCSDVEIETHISDEQLSEKFDTFTDWHNSDIMNKSMDILGDFLVHYGGKA